MRKLISKFWTLNKGLILFLALMFVMRSAVADWNHVPTSSMLPTILVGDRIIVNKMAYDIRVPFTHLSLLKIAEPERGDIIVFDSSVSQIRLVKRVVGIPGDVVAMDSNVLTINGRQLEYSRVQADARVEDLLGVKHLVRVNSPEGRYASFPPTPVPENQFLVLGDNRDNSADSRVIGFVPRREIVGRTRQVAMSFNYDNYYLPRADRFLQAL
jgi:signal peptidase I